MEGWSGRGLVPEKDGQISWDCFNFGSCPRDAETELK